MEAGALQAERAALHGWHDISEVCRIEGIEVPFRIKEATRCLKRRGDGLRFRPVIPVRGS